MIYPSHAEFVAPARAYPQIWRLLVGLALSLLVYVLGFVALGGVFVALYGLEQAQAELARVFSSERPFGTLLILATFLGMALGPILAARLLHKRRAGTLFGPARRTLRDFGLAAAICLALYAIMLLIPSPDRPVPNLDRALWLTVLPLALAGILLQTGAEEILFRGYLQQQLAARFASPLIWMILPSAIFALGHYQPDLMGDNAWLIVLAVGLFAVLAADLTAVTGSIGAAWGFHFANNLVGIAFVAMPGPLAGLALYAAPFEPGGTNMTPLIWLDMGTTLLTWAAIRYVVTR